MRLFSRFSRQDDTLLHALAARLPGVVWTAAPDGAFDFLSPRWRDVTDRDPATALGQGWMKLLPLTRRPLVEACWARHIDRQQPFAFTVSLLQPDGSYHPHLLMGQPHVDDDGALARWYGTFTPLTDVLAEASGEPDAAPHRPTVLLIEDNVDTRLLMERMLQQICTVDCVETPEAGLAYLDAHQPDAILLDIHLGDGMTGLEVLHALRQRPELADVPVAAVTAYALPGDRDHFLREGFDQYLSKPFTAREVCALVQQLLDGRTEPVPS